MTTYRIMFAPRHLAGGAAGASGSRGRLALVGPESVGRGAL